MTNAERQKKWLERQKASGKRIVRVEVSEEEHAFLEELRMACDDPENTFKDFLAKALMTGAKFRANSGGGRKFKFGKTLRRNGSEGGK